MIASCCYFGRTITSTQRRSDDGRQSKRWEWTWELEPKKLGMKEEARKKCKVGFSLSKKNKASQKNCMKLDVKKLLRAGMAQRRTWGAHAAGMTPGKIKKLRRQMAAAAGKKCTTSLSLFMEAFCLELEEQLSMATQTWA